MKCIFLFVSVLLLVGTSQAQAANGPDPVAATAVVNQDSIYTGEVNVKATFRGGDMAFQKYIMNNFRYPARCQDNGISGSVLVRFVVDVDGSVTNLTVIESSPKCPEFAQETIRVLKSSPKWIPAVYNGRKVKSYRELPLKMAVN